MLRYIHQNELINRFVAQLVPHCRRGFGPNIQTLGVLDAGGRLIAGIVYHNYDPEAGIIEMSGAATDPRWLSRATLAVMYRYPFDVCGCQMTVMRVPAENRRLLRILAAYGYTFILVPRLFGRDRDGVLACLTYEAWAANKFNTSAARRRLAEAA